MMIVTAQGNKAADDIKNLSKDIITDYMDNGYRQPKLVVVTIGEDKASKVYVKNKEKAAKECGMLFDNIRLKEDISYEDAQELIFDLNNSNSVDGIIIQFPVPDKFKELYKFISKSKDVDCLNHGDELIEDLAPCTPKGIIYLMKRYNVNLEGKHVVVLGRSKIVGKPLINLLLNENATVTSCNSYTNNLKEITQSADILISAIGKPKFITSSYISDKCTYIIDVGINRDENNKLCGDVDADSILQYWELLEKEPLSNIVDKRIRTITPVPRGVGPMTVAMLIDNTLQCYKHHLKLDKILNQLKRDE